MPRHTFPIWAAALILATQSVVAQESDISGRLSIELNATETMGDTCKLTFLITNGTEIAIDKIVYETVLFDSDGQVDRLTLFDFGTLPPARPRVRQFVIPQTTCEQLGRVLFNSANTCEGAGLDPRVCESGLMPSSRTEIEVLG
ncbi:hypothetical protein [uncultured Sulfitobacter sp.]|uniref:hypothetical protein n=1 Tax=uncultured Sulfitobacter sp. TaxID=191468 RepID=UPI00261CE6EA|nr:hypothetical protein [uncultured Sulfitobacter sp.]